MPAVGGPSRAESGRDAPPTEEPEPGKETVFGAPGVAALQPPQPSASQPPITPPTQPTKKRKRQGPETVDDVLQLALQEAEEAIEHLDPKEAAKLTHSGRHFGGASTMDFKDLMVRKKTGDTGKIRTKVSTGPITEPPPDDEDRAPLTAEAPAAPAHDPQPSAISPQAFVEPTPEDAIPAAFDTPKAPMSTVGVPRFLDDDSAPGAPKAPKALEALPPVPPRGLPQPNTDDHIEELLAKEYSEMRSKGFYGVLDVSPTSQFSEMKYAHARLKLRYGSDNYRSYVLSDRAKEILGLINAAVDRAKGLLASRAERRIYDERNDIEYPTDPEEFYSKLFDAYDFFQQASRRMKMTHWVEAYNLLDRAADLNPDESEYYAYRAWSLYQGFRSGQIRDDFAPNKARQLLEKAIQRRDRCERALYYRACLERDLGNIDDAATFYARLLRINPDHPTARDELKEITRPGGRRQGGTPSKKSLWAKLKALFGGSS